MIWPKRFKLHEAAADKSDGDYRFDQVHATGDRLVAVDGVAIAAVPLLRADERSGADLPRLEPGEAPPQGSLPPKAFQEAAQGSTGQGRLVVLGPHAVEAQRGAEKPWMRFEREVGVQRPPVEDVLAQGDAMLREQDGATVQVCLDAEALVRLSRAIGSSQVRLTFRVDKASLHCEGGYIDVRPAERAKEGPRGVLGAVVILDGSAETP